MKHFTKKNEYITLLHSDDMTSKVLLKGVEENGKILVMHENGDLRAYLHGEVQIMKAQL